MWMIYMKVKKVSRRAEQWSIGMLDASIVFNPSHTEVTQLSDRNIDDGSTLSQTLEVASKRGSISGNDNRRSRYAARTKEAAWQAFLGIYCAEY
jgi:hypothetical protein